MEESGYSGPAHLAWAGLGRTVRLSSGDLEAMDIALALVPEARLAALAVARARELKLEFPIASAAAVQKLLGGEQRLSGGGHEIESEDVRRYLVPGDLPIHDEAELATVIYTALHRCKQRASLQQALEAFDSGLASDPDEEVT